jgi:hypothetical protein
MNTALNTIAAGTGGGGQKSTGLRLGTGGLTTKTFAGVGGIIFWRIKMLHARKHEP